MSASMKKIFLFNGPPGSGKDTIANIFKDIVKDVYLYKMAYPLKEGSHKLLGLVGSLEELEPIKENPINFGLLDDFVENNHHLIKPLKLIDDSIDLRQFYIHLSENVMKPLFGNDIFGKLAVQYITQSKNKFVAISDCGFESEVKPLIEHYGKDNFVLVRLHREGKSFANDSRNYIDISGVQTYDVQNNGTMEELIDIISLIADKQNCFK